MSEMRMEQRPEGAGVRFARTDTLTQAVHLVECPHLVGKRWHDATDHDLATLPVCAWSRDQLEGHGRLHPATLEDAMREHGTPAGAVRLIKQALKFVTYDDIWLPYSRSYVALGVRGRAVASFGKSYVEIGDRRIDLGPGVSRLAGARTSTSGRAQPAYGDDCPIHHVAMSLAGTCDDCN